MCITFQTRHRSRGSGGELPGRAEGEPFVNLGDTTEVVVGGPEDLRWAGMTFGLRERDHGRVALSNARLDQLDVCERWCMLGRQLCAVPIQGWRWTRDGDWVRSRDGWALGFHERAEGFVLVAHESSAAYQPIVVGWEDVNAWMAADYGVAPLAQVIAQFSLNRAVATPERPRERENTSQCRRNRGAAGSPCVVQPVVAG